MARQLQPAQKRQRTQEPRIQPAKAAAAAANAALAADSGSAPIPVDRCAEVKRQLKVWEASFHAANGRLPRGRDVPHDVQLLYDEYAALKST